MAEATDDHSLPNGPDSPIPNWGERIASAVGRERLSSSGNTIRFFHGTRETQGRLFLDFGLDYLLSNGIFYTADSSLSSTVINAAAGEGCIVFIAIPNFPSVRKLVCQHLNIEHETENPTELYGRYVNSFSFVKREVENWGSPDLVLAIKPDFIEGYYDQKTGKWVSNSRYWENDLKIKAERNHWSKEQLQKEKERYLEELERTARRAENKWRG